ncbi:MAG: hypothetical protein V8S27_09555 [Lachnospiraceae bacterium]
MNHKNTMYTDTMHSQAAADEMTKKLIEQATEAMGRAYAPYSFSGGSCASTKDGKIYLGCNIENAGYTPTNCAERTCVFQGSQRGRAGI